MKDKYYQQGDVLLIQVEAVEGKEVKHNGVLAEGEATGHAHRIADMTGLDFFEKDGTLYLRAKRPFTVTHEEHKPQTIPAGTFRVGRVREYDHFAEEARVVAD